MIVVDDDEAIVETLEDLLETEGYQVEGFTDPIRALERLRAGAAPDAVVLDCIMPGLDAKGFLDALTAEGLRIPVVLVTALSDPAFCVDTAHPLAAALINKPLDLDQLVDTLARVACKRAAQP